MSDLEKMARDAADRILRNATPGYIGPVPACEINYAATIVHQAIARATEGLRAELAKWKEGCQRNADALTEAGRRADSHRLDAVELRAELADARKLLSAAACPNGCRDGVIQFRDGDIGQCQWCGERNKLSANETKEAR